MLMLYVIILHALSILGLYFFWNPMLLPLIIIGNIFFSGIGAEIFYHRYVSHASFTCSKPVEWFMIGLSLFSGQGGPIGWGMHHRYHHWHSDTDKDPHMVKERPIRMWFCPNNVRGEWLEPEGCWDLIDSKLLQFLQKWYWWIHFTLVAIVILIDIRIALYLIIIPNMIAIHQQGAINILGHSYGYRNFDTNDNSTNSRWLSIFTFGDNLQNNHHALPWSYTAAVKPNEYDFSAWIIRNFLAKTLVGPEAGTPVCGK